MRESESGQTVHRALERQAGEHAENGEKDGEKDVEQDEEKEWQPHLLEQLACVWRLGLRGTERDVCEAETDVLGEEKPR